jgi:type IV secretion system protein VirB8
MFGKSKKDAPQGEAGKSSRSVNFEISIADIARRSEKRAWIVTGVSTVISLILAGGYFYMLPLKKIEPYMIMADAHSGSAYVSKLQGDYTFKSLTTQEAVQISSVARYIMARESFDYEITRLQDWDLVHLMSEDAVSQTYMRQHASDNPQAPAKLFGRDKALRIKVNNVRPGNTRGDAENPIYEAVASFQRSLYDKRTGQETLLDTKTAVVEFAYKGNLTMTDAQRYQNPLGFRVSSYRVDNDGADATPVAPPPAGFVPVDPNAQVPVSQVPGQTVPGQTVPGQVIPGQALPGQAAPGQVAPGQPLPGQTPAAQPMPGQQVQPPPQFGAPAQPVQPQQAAPQQQPATPPSGVR